MNAVVLSPGPSLALLKEVPPCDLSCAVNRAALRFKVDCWASLDYPMIRDHLATIAGAPTLLTQQQTRDDLNLSPGRLDRFEVVTCQEIAKTIPMEIVDRGWWYVSMGAAITYCAWRGAKSITVYGADWAGKEDFDGIEAGCNREPARWEKERKLFADLKAYFAERGVTIDRVE